MYLYNILLVVMKEIQPNCIHHSTYYSHVFEIMQICARALSLFQHSSQLSWVHMLCFSVQSYRAFL